ncbi:tetratricopeptide repeat protein [Cytobacillus sp. FJAT-54145]|uniref:Tetratricopeptide repeat protein n=1 Tax=Cytobacillus spartinae TaxID=3299023 RepID=A0ABW6K996_9BACI
MTSEKELLTKSYYEHLLEGKEGHPIQILSEMYMDEKKKEIPDFSSIRFCQGEVYFLYKDYEAAIFKWEHIDDDLKAWALKNIADAHYEMDLLAIAEDYYKSVKTDSVSLKMEVLLQLFSLKKRLGKLEEANHYIKSAVNLNPDYRNVTEIARTFFEEYKDWSSAIELANREAVRTERLSWFKVLKQYVEQGYTVKIKPEHFIEALQTLYDLDQLEFENLAALLWNSYKQTNSYFPWLNEINRFLTDVDLEGPYRWNKLPNLYEESYFELISGKFLIRDISELMKFYLTNWMRISSGSNIIVSSSAALAWSEFYPDCLDASMVEMAANSHHMSSQYPYGMEDGWRFYAFIKNWSKKEGLLVGDGHYESHRPNPEELPTSEVLSMIKQMIETLIKQRVQKENAFINKIQWNEELSSKLNGVHHQLSDLEVEKVRAIQKSFRNLKIEFRQSLMVKIPELLQSCSDMVKEDSDFGKLHIEINEEMNKRIADYLEDTATQDFQNSIQGWIRDSQDDLRACQTFLVEVSESIHKQYGGEKLILNCDFKVLDDWRRDASRMTNGLVHLEKTNILMRSTLSQLFMKSVGTLFGQIGQLAKNKEKLQSKYKQFIESADYSESAQAIINPFFQQLELFEKSIERDINQFFSTPYEMLNLAITEAHDHVHKNKAGLNKMKENPEIYSDPLTLFKLKLRQYELMNRVGELSSERS